MRAVLLMGLLSSSWAGVASAGELKLELKELVLAAPSEGGEQRVRASLTLREGDALKEMPLSFWQSLAIQESGGRPADREKVCIAATDEGTRQATPVKWRIILLMDTSSSMRGMVGGRKKYTVAIDAARSFLLDGLRGEDIEVAVQPFDCRVPWADTLKDTAIWARDRNEIEAALARVEQRVAQSPIPQIYCTALFQAVSEADLFLAEKQAEGGAVRQNALVVIGDGVNDLSDRGINVWTLAGRPTRPSWKDTQFLASREERTGAAARELDGLVDQIIQKDPSQDRASVSSALSASYDEFEKRLAGSSYHRFAIGIGAGTRTFDPTALQAFAGGTAKSYFQAENAGEMAEAFRGIFNEMHAAVRISFPTSARRPEELNGIQWVFSDANGVVGRIGPRWIVPPMVLAPKPAAVETWEEKCHRAEVIPPKPHDADKWREIGAAFLIVGAFLAGLWVMVPKYFYAELGQERGVNG